MSRLVAGGVAAGEAGVGERGDIRACGQEQTLAPGYLASSPSFATYNLYKMELNS